MDSPPATDYPNPPPPGPPPGAARYPPGLYQQEPVVAGIPVINPQPQIQAPPQAAWRTGYWSTDLFGCFSDMDSCCLVLWCPCVAFGRLAEIIDKGNSSCACTGSVYLFLYLLGAAAAAFGVPVNFQWAYSCTYRAKLKRDINMPPSCCEDCWIHFLCEPCALCQEYRELQIRGYDPSLGWHRNQELQRQRGGSGMPTTVHAPVASNMVR